MGISVLFHGMHGSQDMAVHCTPVNFIEGCSYRKTLCGIFDSVDVATL